MRIPPKCLPARQKYTTDAAGTPSPKIDCDELIPLSDASDALDCTLGCGFAWQKSACLCLCVKHEGRCPVLVAMGLNPKHFLREIAKGSLDQAGGPGIRVPRAIK